MSRAIVAPTLDQALQVARDVDLEGPGPLLSPDVVTWLAKLALHHPQVSAAVAAALPSSGASWLTAWSMPREEGEWLRLGVDDGDVFGMVERRDDGQWLWRAWADPYAVGLAATLERAQTAADDRLLADGHVLVGLRRAAP
jgi:hypothetical protein